MSVSPIPRLTHKSLGMRLDECAPDNLIGYLGSATMTTYLPHNNQCHTINHLQCDKVATSHYRVCFFNGSSFLH